MKNNGKQDTRIEAAAISNNLYSAIPELLDNLPMGFAVMKVLLDEDNEPFDFIYKYVNHVYAYLMNESPEDLLQYSWGQLFPNEDTKLLGAYANIALNGGSRIIEEIDPDNGKKLKTTCYQPIFGYCACVMEEIKITDAYAGVIKEITEDETTKVEEIAQELAADEPAETDTFGEEELPEDTGAETTEVELAEEIQSPEEAPQEEVKPIEETTAVEEAQPDAEPAEEIKAASVEEIRPLEEVPPEEVKTAVTAAPEEAQPAETENAAEEIQPLEMDTFGTVDDLNAVKNMDSAQLEEEIEKGLASFNRLSDDSPAQKGFREFGETVEAEEEIQEGETVTIFDIVGNAEKQAAEQFGEGGQEEPGMMQFGEGAQEEPGMMQFGEGAQEEPGMMQFGEGAQEETGVMQFGEGVQEETGVTQFGEGAREEPLQAQSDRESPAEPEPAVQEAQPEEPKGNAEALTIQDRIRTVMEDIDHFDEDSAMEELAKMYTEITDVNLASSIDKAKKMVECSMFAEARDLLETLL